MKVYIAPYVTWIGPYQLLDWLPESDFKDKAQEWLASTWVAPFCEWLHEKRSKRDKIRIDEYDTWSADHTLALIIHPLLIKLKENEHSYAFVEKGDVPESLHHTYDAEFGYSEEAWHYALDRMIESFASLHNDWELPYYKTQNYEALRFEEARLQEGFKLFGKYYRSLWT